MAGKLVLGYDCEADVLYIDKLLPYPEQDVRELGNNIFVRLNPDTGDVESLEVSSFYLRLMRGDLFELPIVADFRVFEHQS